MFKNQFILIIIFYGNLKVFKKCFSKHLFLERIYPKFQIAAMKELKDIKLVGEKKQQLTLSK